MQPDVVSGDKEVNAESFGGNDGVSVTGTLVQEEGFVGEREFVAMEVDNVGEGDSGAVSENLNHGRETSGLGVECAGEGIGKVEASRLEVECVREGDSRVVSENLTDKMETSGGLEVEHVEQREKRLVSEDLNLDDKRETSSLEVEMGVVNDELSKVEEDYVDDSAVKEGKDPGEDILAVEGAINDQDSSVKENFNSFAQKLFPNSANDDKCGEEMEVEKAVNSSPCEVNDQSVELESPAATSDKEDCEAYDTCDKEVEAENVVDGSLSDVNHPSVELETPAATSEKVDSGLHNSKGGDIKNKEVSLVDLDECVRGDKKSSKKKGRFCAFDLVWGKVKSHPWWPAQIFEPGDASDKAKKHFKSKGYFVCYFGDQTFAWNAEATLKPFTPNFSKMVKQTKMEAFQHAVDCVLDETSRRVEFGLSCRCIIDDVYNKLKTQVVENAGIREESKIQEGRDRFLTASSFKPMELLDYVKNLAQGPHANVNRLEHVISRAQMAAFYRWKGIYHLAEFGLLIGYVNNEADAPATGPTVEKETREVIGDATVPGSMEGDDNRPKKRKMKSSDSGQSTKKVKCLSDLVSKKGKHKKDDKETERKVSSKSVSPSSRRLKEAKSFPNDSRTKESSPSGTALHLRETKPFFRVGESILRVAGQLNQPSPIFKHRESSPGDTIKDEGNSKECGKHNSEYSSLDVVLSELHLAAIEPLKEHSLLSYITFISDFRNSIVPDSELLQKHEESGEEDTVGWPQEESYGSEPAELTEEDCFSGTKLKAKVSESVIMATSDFKAAEDACTNNTITVLEQLPSFSDGKMTVVEPKPSEANGTFSSSLEMDSVVSTLQQHDGSGNGASKRGQSDENLQQVDSPTALTLKFTDINSIPTEDKLNKIFSHFGPLKESETEVLGKKHCARVVFMRRADAETAFSSSGKFEIFGPSLVCYRLNFAPSPRKSHSVEAKRRKKNGIPVDRIAARRTLIE